MVVVPASCDRVIGSWLTSRNFGRQEPGPSGAWHKPLGAGDCYRDSLLRITIASTVSLTNHDHLAAPTQKKEIPIESKKLAGMVRPPMRKNLTLRRS